MTPEEFAERMATLLPREPEGRHAAADALMCELLRSLGYGVGVDAFEQMGKWYA